MIKKKETNRTLQLFVKKRVRLEGMELQEFQKKEKQDFCKMKKDE